VADRLENIEVHPNNPYVVSVDGVLFSKDKTELIRYPVARPDAVYTIPDGVKHLADGAFQGFESPLIQSANLEQIFFPDTLKSIGALAVNSQCHITELNFPNGLESIGQGAFNYIPIPDTIVIPDSVKSIGNNAFYQNGAKTISIGSGLTTLGFNAFTRADYEDGGKNEAIHVYFRGLPPKIVDYDDYGQYLIFGYHDSHSDFVTIHYPARYKQNWDPKGTGYWTPERKNEWNKYKLVSCNDSGGCRYEVVVKNPTCLEQGYTTHTCTVCGDSYKDAYKDALGHSGEEGIILTAPSCTTDGEEQFLCTTCGVTYTVAIPALGHKWEGVTCTVCGEVDTGNRILLEGQIAADVTQVWIDGQRYPVEHDGTAPFVSIPNTNATNLVIYTLNAPNATDIHTQYPTGMKVWILDYKNGAYTDTYVPELDNLLQYSGSSIRITGKKGIRMITSVTKNNKSALTGKGLAGYKLVEYGTALCWAKDLEGGKPMVLGKPYVKSNYAYKKGVADPVFATSGNLTQYTNVLVGFTLDQCKDDIAMRPYIILQNGNGEKITLYGGIVYRSIGYIAYQNRTVFKPGTASYKYVWEIIHHVYGTKYDKDYKR